MTAADLTALSILVSLVLYVLLGGADFGAGLWDLLARGRRAEAQRRTIEQAIAPVWEANHVWLILALVLLFTGFPEAFSTLGTALHVPLTLLLIGIVLRGAAFVFRQYGFPEDGEQARRARRLWGRVFALSSVLSPIFLGIVVGSVSAGRIPDTAPGQALAVFTAWIAPFPFAVGLFTVAVFALLAALYLVLEAATPELKAAFRRRALFAEGAVLISQMVCAAALGDAHPLFRDKFVGTLPSRLIQGAAELCAFAVVAALFARRDRLARTAGQAQVTLVLVGWGYAQYPYLVMPSLTIAEAAAPEVTLRLLLLALVAGAVVLIPSLYGLLRLFKSGRG